MSAAVPLASRVPLLVKLGYGGGLFGLSIVQIGVSTLLLYFYTDIMGFAPASAGLLMLIGGLTDCGARSEEHTSELQSLMRISYAVFCLKKKQTAYQHFNTN